MNTISNITSTMNTTDAYTTQNSTTKNTSENTSTSDIAAVYEGSSTTQTSKSASTYTSNAELVAKMKADADAQTENLKSIVEKLISGQGNAYGQATDMWQFLSSGNYTVDSATKSQAQADIASDGYWGIDKTSDRILDFAKALTGGDSSKIEEMRSAFEKGYKQATKTWGTDLPSISSDTYDAVMKKFDEWSQESN